MTARDARSPRAADPVPAHAGIGLRADHFQEILESRPGVGFVEIHSENYFGEGGRPIHYLSRIRANYPLSAHGVGLSIGSTDPVSTAHLHKLKRLIERFEPFIVSEHLSWGSVDGRHANDLLPLPYTEDALTHVCERIAQVQEILGRTILIENVSSYLQYEHSTIPEWEFLAAVAGRSGCGILLDVNNVYVNATNHRFDPITYLDAIPVSDVGEIHLAGFTVKRLPDGEILIDTHNRLVADAVWELYATAVERFAHAPTLIEWDTDIPALSVLLAEARKADMIKAHRHALSLRELQRQFIDGLFEPAATVVTRHIRAGDFGGERRLQIYRNNVFHNLTEALRAVYRVVERLVGPDFFAGCANEFIRAQAPTSGDIRDFGAEFPQFLAGFAPAQSLPYLPDVARLEWHYHTVFHAADEPSVLVQRLQSVPEDQHGLLCFRFHPATGLLSSDYPVLRIWEVNQDDFDGDPTVDLDIGGCRVLVIRRGLDIAFQSLGGAEFMFLEHLRQGKDIADACDAAVSVDAEFPVSTVLRRHVQQGTLIDVIDG